MCVENFANAEEKFVELWLAVVSSVFVSPLNPVVVVASLGVLASPGGLPVG